jgi:hypothetical protein
VVLFGPALAAGPTTPPTRLMNTTAISNTLTTLLTELVDGTQPSGGFVLN